VAKTDFLEDVVLTQFEEVSQNKRKSAAVQTAASLGANTRAWVSVALIVAGSWLVFGLLESRIFAINYIRSYQPGLLPGFEKSFVLGAST
jgi:hypothetical protein